MSTINAAVAIEKDLRKTGNLVKVKSIPAPKVGKKDILIKAVAYAVNPTDWKHLANWSKDGAISGSDASGIVEEVGEEVVGFSKGDVVSTFLHGNTYTDKGAFADYVIGNPITTIKYDKDGIVKKELPVGSKPSGKINTFEGAASLTLSLVTVALSFAHNFKLKLGHKYSGKRILIWGGATATGIIAIQVAKKFFDLDVVVTASLKHKDYLTSLGADLIYDYHEAETIKKLQEEKFNFAYDTVSTIESFQAIYDSVKTSDGVVLDNLLFLGPSDIKTGDGKNVSFKTTLAYLADGNEHSLGENHFKPTAEYLADYQEFWKKLPEYITLIQHPNLRVLEPGLSSANKALALLQNNEVRGEKVVFRN